MLHGTITNRHTDGGERWEQFIQRLWAIRSRNIPLQRRDIPRRACADEQTVVLAWHSRVDCAHDSSLYSDTWFLKLISCSWLYLTIPCLFLINFTIMLKDLRWWEQQHKKGMQIEFSCWMWERVYRPGFNLATVIGVFKSTSVGASLLLIIGLSHQWQPRPTNMIIG